MEHIHIHQLLAVFNALVNASVLSVLPSPTAPKSNTFIPYELLVVFVDEMNSFYIQYD